MTHWLRDLLKHRKNRTILFVLLACALCSLMSYLFLDEPVMRWLVRTELGQKLGHFRLVNGIQQLGKAETHVWLLLLWFCLTRRTRAVMTGLIALLLLMPMVLPLKLMVFRERPGHVLARQANPDFRLDLKKDSPSFPSGDTANGFAVATVLTAFIGQWTGLLLFPLAGAVGVLRFVMLRHFVSDVWAGALVGIVAGLVSLRLVRYKSVLSLERFQTRKVQAVVTLCWSGFTLFLWFFVPGNPIARLIESLGSVLVVGLVLLWVWPVKSVCRVISGRERQ